MIKFHKECKSISTLRVLQYLFPRLRELSETNLTYILNSDNQNSNDSK